MHSKARVIAQGKKIKCVDKLVSTFKGSAKGWKKMSVIDSKSAREIHYYAHKGIGKVLIKWAGELDPWL